MSSLSPKDLRFVTATGFQYLALKRRSSSLKTIEARTVDLLVKEMFKEA